MKTYADRDTTGAKRHAAAHAEPAAATAQAVNGHARETAQRARISAAFGATVQRAGPEEELQMKAVAQRAGPEEELLQGRFLPGAGPVQRKAQDGGLPGELKAGVENLSGLSMGHVKVHYNSAQPAQLNALAYAQGSDIHVAPGQEQHLPHEAWHVVQQAQGRVQPTMQMQGAVPVNDDGALESEADAMGARAQSLGAEVQRKLESESSRAAQAHGA